MYLSTLNNDLGLTMTFCWVKYGIMLEFKISCKVLKNFIPEGSTYDYGLALNFSMPRSNLLSGLLYRKNSWIL